MNVKKLKDKLEASETNGDHLVNAMRTVAHSSQQIESVQSKVAVIERQIKDSGLGRCYPCKSMLTCRYNGS